MLESKLFEQDKKVSKQEKNGNLLADKLKLSKVNKKAGNLSSMS